LFWKEEHFTLANPPSAMASFDQHAPLITLDNLIGDTSHIICEESSFVINGLTVQTWIYYNPKIQQKPPIIVIHGGPGFTHNYLLPLKLLAEFGYPLVFYDQAG
jgi:pimeloyl-ACP methyl ester carboxylesterase